MAHLFLVIALHILLSLLKAAELLLQMQQQHGSIDRINKGCAGSVLQQQHQGSLLPSLPQARNASVLSSTFAGPAACLLPCSR